MIIHHNESFASVTIEIKMGRKKKLNGEELSRGPKII